MAKGENRMPLVRHCRQRAEAGLIVAGQYDISNIEGPIARAILEALILESGRPVLVVPQTGQFPTAGARAIIAWNGSREAARALHDALPWIAGASACIVCARTDKDPRPDATPVVHATRVLERHGVRVQVETCSSGSDVSVGELLLSRAADFGADLIVMGAYGHGRMMELVLGGVTRALLSTMTVPVLFSH
ncbi:universal stress protein [Cupriavidus basilensis]